MKKFIIHLSLFTAIVAAIALGMNGLLSKYNDDYPHYALQYHELFSQEVDANAVIIGSSHGCHAIRPSLINTGHYTFYNFALNGGNPQFYLNWYRKAFRHYYRKPDYIIYNVDWFLFNEYWLWRQFEQDSEYFSDELYEDCLDKPSEFNKKSLINNRYPLLKYKEPADLQRAFSLHKGDDRFVEKSYDDGFIPFRIPHDPAVLNSPPLEENAWVSGSRRSCFEQLIRELQSDGIRLIFVMTPEHSIQAEQYLALESFQIILEMARQYEIPFLNYNIERRSDLNNQPEYFSDWGHMNAEGSKVFSKLLQQDLREVMDR